MKNTVMLVCLFLGITTGCRTGSAPHKVTGLVSPVVEQRSPKDGADENEEGATEHRQRTGITATNPPGESLAVISERLQAYRKESQDAINATGDLLEQRVEALRDELRLCMKMAGILFACVSLLGFALLRKMITQQRGVER